MMQILNPFYVKRLEPIGSNMVTHALGSFIRHYDGRD